MRHSTTPHTSPSKRLPGWAGGLLAAAFWVAVWWLIARRVGSLLLLPTPPVVVQTLFRLGQTWDFWKTVLLSLLRICTGCVGGVALGVVLAALTYVSGLLDTLLSPLIRLVRATPVASFIILALLWIGRERTPAFISGLMVAPVVWASVRTALDGTDRDLLEMARAFRFGPWKTVRLIYVGAALPAFRAACSTAVGLAWKSGIAAEVLCQPPDAMGTRLLYAKNLFETGEVFAWTAVVICLSFLLERLCRRLLVGRRREVKP